MGKKKKAAQEGQDENQTPRTQPPSLYDEAALAQVVRALVDNYEREVRPLLDQVEADQQIALAALLTELQHTYKELLRSTEGT